MKKCPRCGSQKFWELSTKQSRCKSCGLTRKYNTVLWKTSKMTPFWKGRLLDYFCLGVPAYRLRFQIPYSLRTIERWFHILREAIYVNQLKELTVLTGQIEMDETMFGGYRPGKRGWGAGGKHIVFGILQRNGKVITFPVQGRGKADLLPKITAFTKPGSLYYTDDWHAYTYLAIRGDHVIIRKEKGKPKGRNHINGIEGFWSYAKHWLYHYRGVPKKNFPLYLKEIEWRFNHREEKLTDILRKYLNQSVVKEQI